MKATLIYERLRLLGYEGSYSVVKRKVAEMREELSRRATVRFETLPGQQAQVDFGLAKARTLWVGQRGPSGDAFGIFPLPQDPPLSPPGPGLPHVGAFRMLPGGGRCSPRAPLRQPEAGGRKTPPG